MHEPRKKTSAGEADKRRAASGVNNMSCHEGGKPRTVKTRQVGKNRGKRGRLQASKRKTIREKNPS